MPYRMDSGGLSQWWKKEGLWGLRSKFHSSGCIEGVCRFLRKRNFSCKWNFRLPDLEDVLLDEEVNEKKWFNNFLQLNTSIPKSFTRTDRLRFLKEYTCLRPVIKNERAFIHRLVEKSRERGIVYVSPDGVVQENFFWRDEMVLR